MKKIIIFTVFLLITALLSAQSADKVTEILSAKTVSLPQVAYFATVYLGLGADEISNDNALVVLEDYIGFPSIKTSQEELSYEDFAYFCTRAWDIKGGVMYRITKAPRYALREFHALGFLLTNTDPTRAITGRDALTLMTKCAEYADIILE